MGTSRQLHSTLLVPRQDLLKDPLVSVYCSQSCNIPPSSLLLPGSQFHGSWSCPYEYVQLQHIQDSPLNTIFAREHDLQSVFPPNDFPLKKTPLCGHDLKAHVYYTWLVVVVFLLFSLTSPQLQLVLSTASLSNDVINMMLLLIIIFSDGQVQGNVGCNLNAIVISQPIAWMDGGGGRGVG